MTQLTWRDIKELSLVSDTTWTRVEGTPRAGNPEMALQARLEGGPYWMLAQQWRFGELLGNDAASPVNVAVTWKRKGFAGPDGGGPELLEAEIEGDPSAPDLRMRLQAGQELARALDEPDVAAAIAAFPLPALPAEGEIPVPSALGVVDAATRSVHFALAGRVADGIAMLEARRENALPPELQSPDVLAALDAVAAWLDRTYPQHGRRPEESRWSPSELGYEARVPLSNGEALAVPDHGGGRLDWWSFDLEETPDFDGEPEDTIAAMPTPVEFSGMPTSTHWQFEARGVNFGRITAAPTDLARLLLAEFALIYGEDWFSIPLELDRGSVVFLSDIEVQDAYGETYVIPPAGAPSEVGWDVWSTGRPSGGDGQEAARLLVVPPVNATATDGPVVEDVLFSRDEMANVLWAIERFGASGLGDAVALEDVWGTQLSVADSPPAAAGLAYTLVSEVPATWHPFSARVVAEESGTRRAALERIPFLRTREDGTQVAVEPLGVLLNKEDPPGTYRLAEEAVPRRPVQLVRRFERARDVHGRVLLWTTIRKMAAEHPQSGIAFDALTDEGG